MQTAMDVQTKTKVPALMAHQERNLTTAKLYPAWGFFDDTGTGKTRLGIEIIRYYKVKTLIICPKSNILSVWLDEILKWAPELSAKTVNLWELWQNRTPKGKIAYAYFLQACDIAIVNYDGFRNQIANIQQAGFKMIIIDESSKLRNPQAKVTKEMIKYADRLKYRYLFSGTPAPNTKMEYWSQVHIINKEIFGNSFWAFRSRYFKQHLYLKFRWDFIKFDAEKGVNLEKEFFDKLKSVSSHVNKNDVLDIPEQTFNLRYIELGQEEQKAYREMVHTLVAKFKDTEVIAANQGVKILKLREITSGFLLRKDSCPGRPSEVIQFGTSKLKELRELLEEIGDHQVIITTQFTHEISQIRELFNDDKEFLQGRTYGTIYGEQDFYSREATRIHFQKGEYQYLISQTRCLATGHNLQNCHYMVAYSLDYSYENQKQIQDRIHRAGQRCICSYYYLLGRINGNPTIDEIIYASLQGKRDVLQAVLNYIRG